MSSMPSVPMHLLNSTNSIGTQDKLALKNCSPLKYL